MQARTRRSPLAIFGRFFLGALFVGTIWMNASGCIFPDHDHDHHDDHWDHHDEHHDHDHDWH